MALTRSPAEAPPASRGQWGAASPETEADSAEIRKILGLDPKASEISVVYGSVPANDKEIALLTRSMLEILIDFASYIQVPAANVEERRTYPTPAAETAHGAAVAPLMQIASSPQAPPDAFAAVPYRNEWYWIDDKDFRSNELIGMSDECRGKSGEPHWTKVQ